MNNHKITNLATPTASTDAATKGYVDDNSGGWSAPSSFIKTTTGHNGDFNGYRGMYNWIQTNGCSGYHVCSVWELSAWFQAGGGTQDASCWTDPGTMNYCCNGGSGCWDYTGSSVYGTMLYKNSDRLTSWSCNNTIAVCCCK